MLQICLVGNGQAKQIHLKNIKLHKHLTVKCIIDPILPSQYNTIPVIAPKNIETKCNQDLLKECDAFIICTPTGYHYYYIKLALRLGKHVMCENPISYNTSEIEECYNLAKQINKVLFCALNRRFHPEYIKFKSALNNLNPHQIIKITRDYPYPPYYFLKDSGGIFHDCVSHDIDLINWLLNNKPSTVYTAAHQIESEQVGANEFDNVTVILEYGNSIMVTIIASRLSTSKYDQRLEIWDKSHELIALNQPKKDESFNSFFKQSYCNELNHFYQCCLNGTQPEVTLQQSLDNITLIQACERSVMENKKITVKYGQGFRNYDTCAQNVETTYKLARINQCLSFVNKVKTKYSHQQDHWMSIKDMFKHIQKHFVD